MTLLAGDRRFVIAGARVLLTLALACGLTAVGKSQTYRDEPFDPTTKALPPAYYGYDPAAFVKSARDESIKEEQMKTKGEFETTAQYHERLSKIDTTNPFATNTYAFGANPTSVSYDADKQTFTLAFRPVEAEGNINYVWTSLQTIVKDAGHHQAQNAFGAVFTVQDSKVSVYQLWLKRAGGLSGCAATATVAPAEAKSINADIRALVVVEPVAPYESTDTQYSEATFNDPADTTTVTGRIFGRLLGVRFYDWVTGQVLGSCP